VTQMDAQMHEEKMMKMKTFSVPVVRLIPILLALSLVESLPVAVHADSSAGGDTQTTGPANANPPANPAPAHYWPAHYWYDGAGEAAKRMIVLDPGLVAEFAPPGMRLSEMAPVVPSLFPGAVQVPSRQRSLRLWNLGSGVDTAAAVRTLTRTHPAAIYSPVFRDGAAGGPMRALPGNLIVYLDPDWGEAEVQTWSGAQQLPIVKPLGIGPNIYLVKAGPGLDALHTANGLVENRKVLQAFPDWWVEVGAL
jgi:hypothetical protein